MSERLPPPPAGPALRPGHDLPRPPAGPFRREAGRPDGMQPQASAGAAAPAGQHPPLSAPAGQHPPLSAPTGQGAERRPPVDPRFRRRWAEARRAEGRRRLRVLLTVASVCLLTGGAFGALHSPLFEVRHVEVVGNVHTPASRVERAAGISAGLLMIDAGSPRAVKAVEALPWVSSVVFERRWPWTLIVKVTERRPVALVLAGSNVDVVDVTGRVLEATPASDWRQALPVVAGAEQAKPGTRVTPAVPTTQAGLSLLLQAASVTPRSLATRHVVLSWSAGTGAQARVGNSQGEVLLGDGSRLAYKMAVLAELAERVQLSGYSLVDLTVPGRPALTPGTAG